MAEALGEERVSWVAVDLVDQDAPARIHRHLLERHGCLQLLVNNAGASWRARFADGGYENVRRTMAINFDAQVRLTEALLPLLRASAPSAIVNVASTAARVARSGIGAYGASKAALAGWSDALFAEERIHGVHVAARGPVGRSPSPRRPPRPSIRPGSGAVPSATSRGRTRSRRRCVC